MPKVYCNLVVPNKIAQSDGLQRGSVAVPRDAFILHLGVVNVQGAIGLSFTAEDRQYAPEEHVTFELLIVPAGAVIPEGYRFRATVLTPPGMLYIFEKDQESAGLVLARGPIAKA